MNLITSSNRIGSGSPLTAWHLLRNTMLVLVYALLLSLSTAITKAEEPEATSYKSTISNEPAAENLRALRGVVVNSQGEPVAEVKVVIDFRTDKKHVLTNADGEFEFHEQEKRFLSKQVIALADNGKLQVSHRLPHKIEDFSNEKLVLRLSPARQLELVVVDQLGTPVANATTGIVEDFQLIGTGLTDSSGKITLRYPSETTIQYLYAFRKGLGVDYQAFVLSREQYRDKNAKPPIVPQRPITLKLEGSTPLRVQVVDSNNRSIPGVLVRPWYLRKPDQPGDLNTSGFSNQTELTTDQNGQVVFEWFPVWHKTPITFWPNHAQYSSSRGIYDPQKGDGTLLIKLDRLIPMRGKVVSQDGTPVQGAEITVVGEGFRLDQFRKTTQTKADGSYELMVAPNMVYLVIAQKEKMAAAPQTDFAVMPDQVEKTLNFQLRPATRIVGQVTRGKNREPVKGFRISLYQYGGNAHNIPGVNLPNPQGYPFSVQPTISHSATTDSQGRYELFVGSGKFDIRGPRQNKIERFQLEFERQQEYNFHTERKDKDDLQGLVVDAQTNKPIANASVYGICRHQLANDIRATTNESGEFHVVRDLHQTVLYATSKDRRMAGIVELGPDDKVVTIPIMPRAVTSGILMAGDMSKTLSNQEVTYGVTVYLGGKDNPSRRSFGGKAISDASGRFVMDSMVVGQEYVVLITTGFDNKGRGNSWKKINTFTPHSAKTSDLGILVLKASYKPAILEEHITREFNDNKNRIGLLKRFVFAKQKAKSTQQHLLFVFGDPQSEAVREFMKLKHETASFQNVIDPFHTFAVNTTKTHQAKAKYLVKAMKLTENPFQSDFFLVITDSQGVVLASGNKNSFETANHWDTEKLKRFLVPYAPEVLDAQNLLDAAMEQAKQQNKRIIILETATWCDPCWRLYRFLEKQSLLLGQDYLVLSLDHRWKNSKKITQQLRGDAEAGIPWWAILDENAKVLVTSNTKDGDNIGFPTGKNGIDHFRKMIEKTAIHMTNNDINQLVEHLSKEK